MVEKRKYSKEHPHYVYSLENISQKLTSIGISFEISEAFNSTSR